MWKRWFPKYKVPKKLEDLVASGVLEDRTHKHDVTPHFETEAPAGTVVLWVDHPERDQRYFPAGPRYMVDLHRPGHLPETLVESDHLDDVLEVVWRIKEEGKGLRLL
jgi:hypothetical protein